MTGYRLSSKVHPINMKNPPLKLGLAIQIEFSTCRSMILKGN